MAAKKQGSKPRDRSRHSADEILYRRYIKGKPDREKSLREVTADMSLGEYLRELRERNDLTQQQLADAMGTKRTAISRLESADYNGHSIELLRRIADAFHGKLFVRIETRNELSRELVLSGQ